MIEIEDAKKIAQDHDCQAAIIFVVEGDGTVRWVTYGDTKSKCQSIGAWAKHVFGQMKANIPFRTKFGWGNDGVPIPLTESEKGQIQKMYDQGQITGTQLELVETEMELE